MIQKILSRTSNIFLLLNSLLAFGMVHNAVHVSTGKLATIDYIKSKKRPFEGIKRDEICETFDCSIMFKDNWSYYYDKGELKRSIYGSRDFTYLGHGLYFELDTLTSAIKVEDYYLIIELTSEIREHPGLFTMFIPLVLIIFFVNFYKLLKDEMFFAMLHKKTIVNNMEILTSIKVGENTAHEIRTPLDVITSKTHKIKESLNTFLKEEDEYINKIDTVPKDRLARHRGLIKLEDDFKLVTMSLDQISDQVDKMSGYKNLLHSNGNKTIHDMIEFAKRSMVMGHDNVKIIIDPEFMKYGVSGLKNSELLGILINHFKNSIEANAFEINVKVLGLSENMLKFFIEDNGNGIPEDLRPHIFESGKSSKQKIGPDEVIRGHGMFSNKILLTKVNGDVYLDRRYRKGTMFILCLPVKSKCKLTEKEELNEHL